MNPQILNQPIYGHQEDLDKFTQAISHIENKAVDIKSNIEQLLIMLDMQKKLPWPDMLDKFSSLAGAMTQLQSILKKSALPSGIEDHGKMLTKHLLVPHRLINEIDSDLEQVTENRMHFWNHDVVPDYLRTKPNPEIEMDEAQLDSEKNTRTFDQINKQISAMNKHLESLLNSLSENARNQTDARIDQATYNNHDTQKLVRSIINGDSLRPSRGLTSAPSASNITGGDLPTSGSTGNLTAAAAAASAGGTGSGQVGGGGGGGPMGQGGGPQGGGGTMVRTASGNLGAMGGQRR